MPEMSGGQAVVQTLIREGVDVIFGLPGVQMYGIIDALQPCVHDTIRRAPIP